MAQTTMDHGKMDMSQPAASMTEGEVKKVDIEAGKVTIKHGPIKHMDMPGMTMVFTAKDKEAARQREARRQGAVHGGE
jgi:Cu/Ag efflux protein CusF